MKQLVIAAAAVVLAVPAMADTFGSGANQFTIDFVTISGDASSANGTNISQYSPGNTWYREFNDPAYNYRMGTYQITNAQWNKFVAEHGKPNGSPSTAYDRDPYYTGTNIPTHCVSWYEAAQFVNWLNIEAGKTAAYKFTGTPGTADYTLGVWDTSEAWGGTNLYRHKDAYYFLPTEDEWVKAAYWNGTSLQTWATINDTQPVAGIDSNFGQSRPYDGPWAVGSGFEELNGTYDMMGNVSHWMESPFDTGNYSPDIFRGVRGGSYLYDAVLLRSSIRGYVDPNHEGTNIGFRVASVPEPASLVLLGLGGLALRYRKR